jgi:hypothetical protein
MRNICQHKRNNKVSQPFTVQVTALASDWTHSKVGHSEKQHFSGAFLYRNLGFFDSLMKKIHL